MKLAICPFCGGPADWCRKGHKIMCQYCCASVSGNDMQEAVDKWNNRQREINAEQHDENAKLRRRVEALREAVSDIATAFTATGSECRDMARDALEEDAAMAADEKEANRGC